MNTLNKTLIIKSVYGNRPKDNGDLLKCKLKKNEITLLKSFTENEGKVMTEYKPLQY